MPLFHIGGKPLGDGRSELRRACKAAGVAYGRKVAGGFVFAPPLRALTSAVRRFSRSRRPASSSATTEGLRALLYCDEK